MCKASALVVNRHEGRGRGLAGGLFALALLACRSEPGSGLERALGDDVTAALGVRTAVRCTAAAAGPRCQALLEGGVAAPLALTPEAPDGARLRWRFAAPVVALRPLEAHLAGELAALGLSATPRCSAPFVVVRAPQRLACELGGLGTAWVALRPDGSYDLELALGAAAAARREEGDAAALEELSRALDRAQGADGVDGAEGAEGAEGDGEDDGEDEDTGGAAGARQDADPARSSASPPTDGASARASR